MKGIELWKKINNTEKIREHLMYLYERWQDEKKYEDINDYLESMKRLVPEAYKISGDPFSITFKCEDGDLYVLVKEKGDYLTFTWEFQAAAV